MSTKFKYNHAEIGDSSSATVWDDGAVSVYLSGEDARVVMDDPTSYEAQAVMSKLRSAYDDARAQVLTHEDIADPYIKEAIRYALMDGKPIHAIKILRANQRAEDGSPLTLKDAKAMIDSYRDWL